MSIGVVEALLSLRPGAAWSCKDVYETIIWLDENQTMPTKEEIDAEIVRLQQVYIDTEYQRQRAAEYPSWEDQMDILFHNGYDGWKAAIQAVKDKYPKPV